MDDKLIKILKELRGIQPDADYTRHSKTLVLASLRINAKPETTQKNYRFLFVKLSVSSVSIIAVSLIILMWGYYYNPANKNNVLVQANDINDSIQVKLNEIQYILANQPASNEFENINKIQSILEKVSSELKEAEKLNAEGETDKALNKIKNAQNYFKEIDYLLKN